MNHRLQHILLVGLCPWADRQLCDLNRVFFYDGYLTVAHIAVVLQLINGAFEILVPRMLCRKWEKESVLSKVDVTIRSAFCEMLWSDGGDLPAVDYRAVLEQVPR